MFLFLNEEADTVVLSHYTLKMSDWKIQTCHIVPVKF